MSTSTENKPINYREIYFPHPSLRKIVGNPTFLDLQILKKQVKANAASVPSTLGGGNNGHLGLVSDATTYARVSDTAYIRPTLPPALEAPPQGTTGPQIAERQRLHNLQVAMFHEANHIKRTILNQIQEACDETTLNARVNDDTGMLMGTAVEILQYLFDTYGNITDQKIAEERQRVMQHKYVHDDPIANVFSAITTYANMAEGHGTPETNEQLISIGKIIMTNARIFADAVKKWNRLDPTDQTWARFKTHFTTAQVEYKKVRPVDTSDSFGYSNPNNVVDQVLQAIDQRAMEAATLPTANIDPTAFYPPHHAANSTVETDIKKLLETVQTLQNQIATHDNDRDPNKRRRGQRGRNALTDVTNHQRGSRNQKYCWTHGACNHTSGDCTKRAPGHCVEATFQNMMGGSTKRCFWINPSA